MENRLFVDANIFLDLLLNRGDFGGAASKFFENCVDKKVSLVTSISCIQTMIYVLKKSGCTSNVIKQSVYKINKLVALANTTNNDISEAVKSDFKDLEDAILYYTALSDGCNGFITRNIKDFPESNSQIQILKPESFD